MNKFNSNNLNSTVQTKNGNKDKLSEVSAGYYKFLIVIVLIFISFNVYKFNHYSISQFNQIEKPYLMGRGVKSPELIPVIGKLLSTLSSQQNDFTLMILTILFIILAIVLPIIAKKHHLVDVDFYILLILFLLLPVVYSKDTKENFLLVKETYFRIFTIGLFALYIFRNMISGQFFQKLKKVPKSGYLLMLLAIFSLKYSICPSLTVHFTAILISYFIFYLILEDGIDKKWQLISLCNIAVAMAALDSAYGILQYYGFDPLFGAGEVVGNEDRKRVFSFFGNPVFIGVYLDAVMPVALSLFLYSFTINGDYKNKVELIVSRISSAILLFSSIFPILFYKTVWYRLRVEHNILNFGPLLQKKSQAVSQIMRESSSVTFYISILAVVAIISTLVFLRYTNEKFRKYDKKFSQGFIGFLGFLFVMGCLFITFTRTAWIAVAVSMVVFIFFLTTFCSSLVYKYRKYILSAFLFFIILSMFLTYNYFDKNKGTESISARLTSSFTVLQRLMLFDISIKMWKDHEFFGSGWGTFGKNYPIYQRKFYTKGPFILIPAINKFCATTSVNFILNYMVYIFYMLNLYKWFVIMMAIYFLIATSSILLYISYYKVIREKYKKIFNPYFVTLLVILILPIIFSMNSFNKDLHNRSLLELTFYNGKHKIVDVDRDSIKVGVPFKNNKDMVVKKINDLYLSKKENVMSEKPLDYDWLAAGFAHAHNEYFQVMTDLGLPGIIAYLSLFLFFFITAYRLLLSLEDTSDRLIVIGFIGTVVAGMVESLANFPYQRLTPVVMTTLAFLVVYKGKSLFLSDDEEDDDEKSKFLRLKSNDLSLSGGVALSIASLFLVYFPLNYVSSNILLKSGHVRLMEFSRYYSSRNGRTVAHLFMDSAEQYLKESVKRVPYQTEASFWLSDLYRMKGHMKKAIKQFKETLKYGNNKNVYNSLGITYYELSKRATTKSERDKYIKEAIKNWVIVSQMNPNFFSAPKRLGQYYLMNRSYKSAEIYLKQACKFRGGDLELYQMLAKSQEENRDRKGLMHSLEHMRKYTKRKKLIPQRYYIKYASELIKDKKIDEAYDVLDEYIKFHKNDKKANMIFFNLCFDLKEFDRAKEILKNIFKGNLNNKEYHRRLASIYQLEHKFNEAYFELVTAYNLDTRDIKLKKQVENLEKMLNGKK